MTEHLWSNSLLCPQACDSNQTGGYSAHGSSFLAGRVCEQTAVFAVDDEDGQIGVCLAEFVFEFGF